MVERIACWSARHRVLALCAWLFMVGSALLAGQLAGTSNLPEYDPGQSGVAEQMLTRLNVVTPPSESVLIQSKGPGPERTFTAYPPMRLAARQVVTALRELPATAANIQSPFGRDGKELIEPGGGGVLITFRVAGPNDDADNTVVKALHAVAAVQARHPSLIIAEAGDASVDRAATAMLGQDFHSAERTSVPLTLLLLLIVFGALIAASIPVILAGTAVMTAVSLLAIPSRFLPIGQGTSEVVLIIGMAVGIDYTLFYLRREREERAAGASFHDALRTAAATSGRAIVISGPDRDDLAGRAVVYRDHDVHRVRHRHHGRRRRGRGRVADRVAGAAVAARPVGRPGPDPVPGKGQDPRRPVQAVERAGDPGGAAAAGLGRGRGAGTDGAGLPGAVMRLGSPSINLPSSLPIVRTLSMIQRDFPGGPAPAQIVVAGPGVHRPEMTSALSKLTTLAEAGGPIHSRSPRCRSGPGGAS